MVSQLVFKSFIHLEFIFAYGVSWWSSFIFLHVAGFIGEFYKTVKEELTPILHRLFQKIQDRKHPYAFYEASIIQIPKPDKHNKGRKIQPDFADEHTC